MMAALVAASFSVQAGCRMQHGDSMDWKGDKRAHLGWSAVTGAVVDGGDAYLELGMTYWQKVGVAVVPGLLREVATGCGSDTRAGFSHQDNAYNLLGAMLGVGVGHGVRVLLTPRSVHIHMEL
jgi:hypothetical protein